jgi:hypothetical protein
MVFGAAVCGFCVDGAGLNAKRSTGSLVLESDLNLSFSRIRRW